MQQKQLAAMSFNDEQHDVPTTDTDARSTPDDSMIRLDGLPSMGYPYGGYQENYVHIRPLRWGQLELLARASELDEVEPVIKAVGQCIDRDVDTLTIPDFFFLLYWLRINSYPSTPYVLPWQCDEPKEDGGECGHQNLSHLTQKSIIITDLEELGWTAESKLPEGLDWPRVSLLPQLFRISRKQVYEQGIEEAKANLDDATSRMKAGDKGVTGEDLSNYRRELRRLTAKLDDLNNALKDDSYPKDCPAGLIEVLRWVGKGNLRQRHEFMLSQPDLTLFEAARKADDQWQYGVHEEAKVTCKECGASRLFRIVVDVPTFLS